MDSADRFMLGVVQRYCRCTGTEKTRHWIEVVQRLHLVSIAVHVRSQCGGAHKSNPCVANEQDVSATQRQGSNGRENDEMKVE